MLIRRKEIKFIVQRIIILFVVPIMITSFTSVKISAKQQIDSNEINPFMDGLFASQLESYHVPGAVISVVQDGKIVFSKGYGYGNVENRLPVLADETLFRVGSVSKLFVWTAAMQLAEQGKLDLNADINIYLQKFKIPNTFEKPITMMNLMNHNAGFEERAIGESVGSAADIKPLEEYLIKHMPARVRAPGEFTAYSNYGASLAGYIVSQISGVSFEQYMEENIFKHLNMQHSSFRQPLPPNLKEDMAVGYSFEGGQYKAHDFEWKQSSPAGAMSATAADMANFMTAMLNKGSYNNTKILQENTAVKMQKQSYTNDIRVNGIAHGFMVSSINNQYLLSHGGDIFQFHSSLVLLPEQNIGLFVAYNGAEGMAAVNNTITAFMDHYFPIIKPAPQVPMDLKDDALQYEGTYMPARHEYTTLGKLVGLLQSITIKKSEPHKIKVSLGFPAQMTANYVEIKPGIFRSQDVPPLIYGDIVFSKDSTGKIKYQFQENNPTTAYIKLPWYAAPGFTMLILAVSMIVFISVIIWIPIRGLINLRFKYKETLYEYRATIISRLTSALSVVFIFLFSLIFSKQETVFGLPDWSKIIFSLPYVIAMLAIYMVILAILAWKKGYWHRGGRIYYTLITITTLSFVCWMIYWNLWVFKV
jgi:CubicO group peptidase (beta-lactamase class C family)